MDLQGFLERFESYGALRRIQRPVAADLELAALTRREFARPDNRVLLFEQVDGTQFPVASNLFGSEQRIAHFLRCRDLTDFSVRLATELEEFGGRASERLQLLASQGVTTQTNGSSPYRTLATDLTQLPAVRSWPQERERYFTLPLVMTCDLRTGARNLGIYRAQLLDQQRLALNFAPGTGAAQHLAVARQMNRPLPVALLFGGDPVCYWLAAAPLPAGCDELAFGSRLFQLDLALTEGSSQPIAVPSHAEFVIEGEIDPQETAVEGPFGNHTGLYVSRADCPVLKVTSIICRRNPVMPITVVGPPPSENLYLAKANQCLIEQLLKIDYPQISALQMPEMTIFHGVSLIGVKRTGYGKIADLVQDLWQDSPLQKARVLIFFDEEIDLQNYQLAYWRLINQIDEQRVYRNGHQLALDATGIDPDRLVVEDEHTAQRVLERFPEF